MMSMRDFETKHLIFKGFEQENIHNPFIAAMMKKQEYSMSKRSLPNAIAWYITPFINAMVRSGTEQEKEIVFQSFLKFKAFEQILSDKRGHKLGETEQLITQALRVVDRVKRRQGDSQDETMEMLERMIEEQNLLEHKVLLFLLEPGAVNRNIAGLAANKIMGKYQRPCAVLTLRSRAIETPQGTVEEQIYEGSARGCDAVGVTEFKDLCEETGTTDFVAGHQGAFGLGLLPENIDKFLTATDNALYDMSDTIFYPVDYIYQNKNVNAEQILDIANLSHIYGKDIEESLIAIQGLRVTADMVQVYEKRNLTLKITLPNQVSIMLFDAPEELCNKLKTTMGYVEMDIIGEPKKNEYNGWVTPQIFIKDYEITGESRFIF